jgi:transposase
MFHVNQNLKVVLAVRPVDLRKSFHGLYAAARQLQESPEKGALFVFCNRPRNRVKVLCFDGTGCWVSTKRRARSAGRRAWTRSAKRCA